MSDNNESKPIEEPKEDDLQESLQTPKVKVQRKKRDPNAPKKPRSEAQKQAFLKCQAIRKEKILERKIKA